MIFHLLPRFPIRYCGLRSVVIFDLLPRFPSQILWFEKCVDFSFVAKVSLSNIVVREVW